MNDKQNYRPVSTSNLSKVFEKLIYSQINTYMSGKFCKYLTGICKNHNTQHALIIMIESWKSNRNKANKVGVVCKVFDTLDHSLLIAKLEAYDFDTLFRIYEELPNKQQANIRSEIVLLYEEKLHLASRKVPYLDPCFLTST